MEVSPSSYQLLISWSKLLFPGLLTIFISLIIAFWSRLEPLLRAVRAKILLADESADHEHLDSLILKNYSEVRSYVTPIAVYKSIRTFYHPHPHSEKLPDVDSLPLLVFIHGLGGSLVQFAPLLGSLVNVAPTFGIDLPGCGLSEFSPTSFNAYSIEALAALVKIAIETTCQQHGHKSVVIVAHSFGCPISALLTSKNASAETALSLPVRGLVAICPKASRPTKGQAKIYRMIFAIPDFVLDASRWLDRRGGTESKSVTRFVGQDADIDLKRLQLRLNNQFLTPVLKRTVLGAIPRYDSDGNSHGGLPGEHIWKGINVPLLLISGEADVITKLEEVDLIISYLKGKSQSSLATGEVPGHKNRNDSIDHPPIVSRSDEGSFGMQTSTAESKSHHDTVIKIVTFPAPATHALLYDHATYRTVAGLIEDFLSKHVSQHLSLGWQLQQMTTTGKWDVKNLEKWKRVIPVSGPIAGGLFRALKTLREQDEEHTPAVLVEKWRGKIYAVIDISHDRPIYNTQTLEKGGIQYHKFPTVSKVPPTPAEVKGFIALVERLRKEINCLDQAEKPAISCHCHYGYNRTGFFIISYLMEKENYQLQDAIDEFAQQKPPGIKHDHFLDTLFVRYCKGLRKAPTFI
jgi:pimeloyl-ACP methyl ester carboxylesterase/protein-tyrosine phosphatase